MTKTGRKPYVSKKLRRKEPKVEEKDGKMVLMCPFCNPPHPLSTTHVADCGTFLEVKAVQPVFRAKAIVCVKCGGSGGTMKKVDEHNYAHTFDCAPDKEVHHSLPENSLSAQLAYLLPVFILKPLAKRLGKQPQELYRLDEEGNPTGRPVGYCWVSM